MLPHNFGTLGKMEVRWGLLLKLHHFCPCRLNLLRIFPVVMLATLMPVTDASCLILCVVLIVLWTPHIYTQQNPMCLKSLTKYKKFHPHLFPLLFEGVIKEFGCRFQPFIEQLVLSGALSFCCLPDTLSSFGGTIVTLFEMHLKSLILLIMAGEASYVYFKKFEFSRHFVFVLICQSSPIQQLTFTKTCPIL